MGTQLFPGPGATTADEPRLMKQLEFVRDYMENAGWVTIPELVYAFNLLTQRAMLETSASAHIRALRRKEHGGFEVERRTHPDGTPGKFQYRIAQPKIKTRVRLPA